MSVVEDDQPGTTPSMLKSMTRRSTAFTNSGTRWIEMIKTLVTTSAHRRDFGLWQGRVQSRPVTSAGGGHAHDQSFQV